MHAFGVDDKDLALSLQILFQMLFLVRVTSTEYNWVTLAEGRQKVAVGTVRKSIAAIASRWLLRKVSQRLPESRDEAP